MSKHSENGRIERDTLRERKERESDIEREGEREKERKRERERDSMIKTLKYFALFVIETLFLLYSYIC